MMNKIKKFIGLPKSHEESEWEITILKDGAFFIKRPYRLLRSRAKIRVNQYDPDSNAWAVIETKLIGNIQHNCVNPHTCLRLYTHYVPKKLLCMDKLCQVKNLLMNEKDANLYIFPDCQEPDVWQAFFETGTIWHGGRTLFTLNYQPDNWEITTQSIFNIVQKLISNKLNLKGIDGQLQRCCLLSYSLLDDDSLVIAKSPATEGEILSIINDIAEGEGLDLTITRRT